jgi:NitT/TauT family transport system ATP-binding protein
MTIDVPRPRRRRDEALTRAARNLRAELSGRSAEL